MNDPMQHALEKRDKKLAEYRGRIDGLESLVEELRTLCIDCWHELNEEGGEDFPHKEQRVTMSGELEKLGLSPIR